MLTNFKNRVANLNCFGTISLGKRNRNTYTKRFIGMNIALYNAIYGNVDLTFEIGNLWFPHENRAISHAALTILVKSRINNQIRTII